MKRDEMLAAVRRMMLDERRHGIGYWCDPELATALREKLSAARRTGATAPAAATRVVTRPAAQPSAPAPLPPPPSPRRAAGVLAWGPPPKATGRESGWAEQLAELDAVVKRCKKCGLCEERTKTVFGSGKAIVPLVFVGEAPGADEDRQGLPFVGRAGELLTRIIAAMGLSREDVYICNVLKCRPPGNRDPLPDEVGACGPHLERQLELLKPKVICSLGRHSTAFLTGQEGVAMKNVRGRVFMYRGVKVIPTYHPAALLRNPSLKALVWEDVQKVRALLDASSKEE